MAARSRRLPLSSQLKRMLIDENDSDWRFSRWMISDLAALLCSCAVGFPQINQSSTANPSKVFFSLQLPFSSFFPCFASARYRGSNASCVTVVAVHHGIQIKLKPTVSLGFFLSSGVAGCVFSLPSVLCC